MPLRRWCVLFDDCKALASHSLSASSAPSGDELLLTEMIFNGLFNDLTVEQATALLSCFVFQENVRPNARKHFGIRTERPFDEPRTFSRPAVTFLGPSAERGKKKT